MSHNNNKVNAQEPTRQGAITQALNDLSDTASAASVADQVLAWSGSEFHGVDAENAVSILEPSGIGEPANAGVYNPALESGWFFSARTVGSGGNMVTSTTDSDFVSVSSRYFTASSQYFEHLTLTKGYVYQLHLNMCIGGNSDAGASIEVRWEDSSGNALGPRNFLRQKGENRTPVRGVIDLTSATVDTDVGLQRVGSGVTGNARYILTVDDLQQFNLTVRILS